MAALPFRWFAVLGDIREVITTFLRVLHNRADSFNPDFSLVRAERAV